MLPCKTCITRPICRNRIYNRRKQLEKTFEGFDKSTSYLESLTHTCDELSKFCKEFSNYFPYFPGAEPGQISYPDGCGIPEEDWFKRTDEIYDFFFDI